MRPRKPYKGVLRRKLPSPVETPIDVWCIAHFERLEALADHYGLDSRAPGFGLDLALQLAGDHVEGFQLAKKSGRPPKPGQVTKDIILCIEIMRAREEGRTDASAYRRAAKLRGVPEDMIEKEIGTLRKRFGDLMKPTTATVRMWRMLADFSDSPDEKLL